jgi:hypothetical protein
MALGMRAADAEARRIVHAQRAALDSLADALIARRVPDSPEAVAIVAPWQQPSLHQSGIAQEAAS